MLLYILRRLAWFVPLFFVISFIAFGLSKMTPGDPVANLLQATGQKLTSTSSLDHYERSYRSIAERLGLDKAAFYCSFSTAAQSDTLHQILRKNRRSTLYKLAARYGSWEQVQAYYHELKNAERTVLELTDSLATKKQRSRFLNTILELYIQDEDKKIKLFLQRLADTGILNDTQNRIQTSYTQLQATATPYRQYIPTIYWHGFNNQYHHWISGFLRGDFGISLRDYRPISDKIKDALFWTLLINITAIFIAYSLAIFLAVLSARKKDSKTDRGISLFLFMLYSLPNFWVAILLITFFTTPEYGAWTDIFPSVSSEYLPSGTPLFERFWQTASRLLLPIICVTYGSLAFIARQTRGAMLAVLPQIYIQTARAKGLSERKVIWKHAFRNALFPLITIFASVLPATLTGSVIIERIFNIQGMGWLILDAILQQEWSIVYAILMLGAVMTMLGMLLADLLYVWADPRVELQGRHT